MKLKKDSWLIKYASFASDDVVESDWEYEIDEEGKVKLDADGFYVRNYTYKTNSCNLISGIIKSTLLGIVLLCGALIVLYMFGTFLGWIAALIVNGMILFEVADGPVIVMLILTCFCSVYASGYLIVKTMNKSKTLNSATDVLVESISAKAKKICLKIDLE